MQGTALCSKINPVAQSVNEALVIGSLLPLCLNLMDAPWMKWKDGTKRKEQFCTDSIYGIWMGLDHLTVFKDLRYRSLTNTTRGQRRSAVGGMGHRMHF